jgi:hypothetical protein
MATFSDAVVDVLVWKGIEINVRRRCIHGRRVPDTQWMQLLGACAADSDTEPRIRRLITVLLRDVRREHGEHFTRV